MLEDIFGNKGQKALQSIKRRVKKVLSLLPKGSGVITAVSGGKDSTAMAFLLKTLGVPQELLFLDLGLGSFSRASKAAVEELAEVLQLPLRIVRVENPAEIKKAIGSPRPVCSICGIIKRWWLNHIAWEEKAVVATGHNLEDMASFAFSSLLSGDLSQINRLAVYLEGNKELKMAPRLKPVALISEEELKGIAEEFSLPVVKESCPYSLKAKRNKLKEKLLRIFTRPQLYSMLYRLFFEKLRQQKLVACKRCGHATIAGRELCSYCALVSKLPLKNK